MKHQIKLYGSVIAVLSIILMITGPAISKVSGNADAVNNPVPVTTVSAASYEAGAIAPGSIASAFGTLLATGVVVADTLPLPTMLGNTMVTITDSMGTSRTAGLFFVSPGQINFLVDAQTAAGQATVTVQSGDGTISVGLFEVKTLAPAIFSANADGLGVPAAVILRVKGDGTQTYEPLSVYDNPTSRFVPTPIDLGPDTDQVFLILYGSGIRNAADPNGDMNSNESVQAVIGGDLYPTLFAGAAPGFVGLDQVNLLLSRSLIGRGKVNVSVAATGGTPSNQVEIDIAGAGGAAPPQISGFNQPNALAGQTINLNGAGFSPVPAENLVRVAGSEADVTAATPNQLTVQLPYGVSTGNVTVSTAMGEGISNNILNIRTSISGLIETTDRDPIPGIKVKVAGTNIETTSTPTGNFLLPDVQKGVQALEIDTSSLPTNLPYPTITRKLGVQQNRDNPLSTPVQIQPANGPSVNVGGSGFAAGGYSSELRRAAANLSIQTGGIIFELPDDVSATFPDGSTSGTLTLTKIKNSRVPVPLPSGIFSSSIVQITPFAVRLDPGGKLTFPNSDNLPAGSMAVLYTLDLDPRSPTNSTFIPLAKVNVSADGQTIETPNDAVKLTSIFFVSVKRQTTALAGKVVESDGTTPVRGALVTARSQEGFTDGNGGFILRDVPVFGPNDLLTVEASILRPSGRVERTQRTGIAPLINDTTIIKPALQFAAKTGNRPPTIIADAELNLYEGGSLESQFLVFDPDPDQTPMVSVGGAPFASIQPLGDQLYALFLKPGAGSAGKYTVKLAASDGQGGMTEKDVQVGVFPNQAPTLSIPQIPVISQGQLLDLTFKASDPDPGQKLSFSATGLPQGASLTKTSATTARLLWTPTGPQAGDFTIALKVTDDAPLPLSDTKNVSIKVLPVSDLTVTKTDGVTNYIPGGRVFYTIVVSNKGPGDVINALVSDTKSPQISGWSWECTQSTGGATGCTPASDISTDFTDLINLPSGASITYTVQTSIRSNATGNLINSVSVVPPEGTTDPNPNDNSAVDIDMVSLQGDLSITKTDNSTFYTPGGTTTYTIVVRNSGPSNITGAVVTDLKPTQIDNWSWTCLQSTGGAAGCDGVQTSTANFTDTVDLPAGGSITYSVLANISSRATGTLINTATVAPPASVTDPDQTNNSATDQNLRGLLWEPTGVLEGGIIQSLLSDGEVVIAGSFSAGIFRSLDNGDTWENVLQGCQVESLVRNSSAIFAGTFDCGILRSVDQGKTWTSLKSAPAGSVTAMAATDNAIYAGYFNGEVHESSNNGDSWTPLGAPAKTSIRALIFFSNALLAGTGGEGIFFTDDQGKSWDTINVGLDSGQIHDFLVSGNNLLTGTSAGVYRYDARILAWVRVSSGLEDPLVISMGQVGNAILAGTGSGVFFSQDLGQKWEPLVSNDRIDKFVLAIAAQGSSVFAGTYGGGVFRFLDGWNRAGTGLNAQLINSMASRSGQIFAATEGGQVFSSDDEGKTWTDITSNLNVFSVYSMLVEAGELLVGANSGVYRYIDGQNSWVAANQGISRFQIFSLASRNGVLFAGTASGGIFRSIDGAKTWQGINKGLTSARINDLITAGQDLLAATDAGIFISKDNGENWSPSSNGIGSLQVNSLIFTGKTVLAGTFNGIYRSDDLGANWSLVSAIDASSFAVIGGLVLAGTKTGGAYFSMDEGVTWQQGNAGLLNPKISDFTVSSNLIFAGTGGGVFRAANPQL